MAHRPQEQQDITLAVVLFPGFEPLDAAGPLELFGLLPCVKRVLYVAEAAGPVTTETARMTWLADTAFADLAASSSSSSSSAPQAARPGRNIARAGCALPSA